MNDSEKLPLNYSQQSTTVNVQRCRCRLRFKLNQKIIIPEILYSLPRMLILVSGYEDVLFRKQQLDVIVCLCSRKVKMI